MVKLCFDYGHGGEDSGACYKGRKEAADVLSLGRAVATDVRRHGVVVHETRTRDVIMSLSERTSFENRNSYDYFISFHRNAFQPELAKGVETYIHLNGGSKPKVLAEKIQTSLVALGFIDRGVKKSNYYVLRETKAPAILIEMGFVDNSGDNILFDTKRNEIIKALAKAILAQVGIDYIEASVPTQTINEQTLYSVMAGSYSARKNAENQVQKLKEIGIDATIMIFNK